MSEKIQRKRGAQPGNLNALKHGFYSRSFGQVEVADLDVLANDSGLTHLVSEVALLRVRIRRMQEYLEQAEASGQPVDPASALNALGMACMRVAGLLKTEKFIAGDHSTAIATTITQALSDITKELKLSV